MSWLTGNLSTLASNVSNFTKEVLTEATKEDQEDVQNDNIAVCDEQFNPALRDELLFLRSEVSNKDQHIHNLQSDNERLKEDAERHSRNLKQHLLEKEVEIEQIIEKLNQSESKFEEKFSVLSKEKSQLEQELSEKMANTDNDDWDNNWGGGGGSNDEELSILKTENDSLCNEISMKEIILNSIESKMQQLSGKNLDVSDFSGWIDEFLGEKLKEKDEVENLTELVMYLKEEMNDDSDDPFDMDVFLEWYTEKKEEKVTLEQKIRKLENTIRSVEDSISHYRKSKSKFQIADLDSWLENLSSEGNKTTVDDATTSKTHQQSDDNGSKQLLADIQNAIREFDEEDEDFELEDFQGWIEKVQNKIDDLEVDLLNEQEMKTTTEKHRAEERSKLKEMFVEKENEIAMLKVELFNASSVAPRLPPQTHEHQDPTHHTLQEQLNEAIARTETLQNELIAARSQESNLLEKHKNEINNLQEEIKMKMESEQNGKQILNDQLKMTEQSLETLQNELQLLKIDNAEVRRCDQENSDVFELQQARLTIDSLNEGLQEAVNSKEMLVKDYSNIGSDIKTMENIVMDAINGEHMVFNESLEATSDKTSSLLKAVKGVVEHSSYLQQENRRISDDLQTLQNQFKEQEDQMMKEQSELTETQQLLEYVAMMVTKMFPSDVLLQPFTAPDGSIAMETQQYETNMVACDSYLKNLILENIDLREKENESFGINNQNNVGENSALKQEIEELNNKIAKLENGVVPGAVDDCMDGQMQVLAQQLTDLQSINMSQQTENNQLKQMLQSNSEVAHTERNQDGDKHLQNQLQLLTQQVSELQTHNESYQTQNQQLALQLSEIGSQHATAQEELQGHVTTLNQQLQQYQQFTQTMQAENEHLKRLNNASMTQGPDQDVAIRIELQNQVNVLTHGNQHYQSEYENLRQGWMKYQQESNTYIESIQSQYQQLQSQYQQLEANSQQMPETATTTTSHTEGGNQQQEKMHNLSLLLTEKAEECVKYQQENDQLRANLVEIQNDASDMELIREECKQLKTMLISKEHESGVDETIAMLQSQCKQLKNMLSAKDIEVEQIQKSSLEKDNELSDMELLREECKQLKMMLVNKDTPAHVQELEEEKARLESELRAKEGQLQRMNASVIDMQNSTSDMELLREECNQLKQMLMNHKQEEPPNSQPYQNSDDPNESIKQLESQIVEKDEELRSKDTVIAELQNTSTDVELLRQQCEQLKTMLSEKDASSSILQNNTGKESNNTLMESSFLMQVQQLEELMREKDEAISQKNEEILHKDTIIVELQNSTSDMELLHNECRALKEMISRKETVFAELQNDLDLANDVIGQKSREMTEKANENDSLRYELTELQSTLIEKDQDIETLRAEISESVIQDENIHLLQTEYRNVEEQFKSTQKELQDSQQKLLDAETHCDRLKGCEEQCQDLKLTLKEKEEELDTLRFQSSKSSILESETVTILQQELTQLKSIVCEREQQTNELNNVLEKKSLELQDLSMTYNHTREQLLNEEHQKKSINQQIEELTAENNRLIDACQEKDRLAQDTSANENNLRAELDRVCQELDSVTQQNYNQPTVEELTGKTQTQEVILNQQNDQISQLYQQIQDLEATKSRLEQEGVEIQNVNGQYINAITELQTGMQNLQFQLQQSEHNRQQLLQSLYSQQQDSAVDKPVKVGPTQQQMRDILIKHLRSLLQLPEWVDTNYDISNGLTAVVERVKLMLSDIQQKDIAINRLQADYQAAIEKYQQTELTEGYDQATGLDNNTLQANLQTEHARNLRERDFKITDLQSQLQEFNELEAMYQQKCKECEELQAAVVTGTVVVPTTESLQTSSSNPAEYEQLKDELAKNSHSLLDKTKECDELKRSILQLKEMMFNQQQTLSRFQNAETQLAQMDQYRSLCQAKDAELQNLQSQLEDSYAMLEGGKKEKEFLDQLVKEKNAIATEKEELVFQNGRLASQLKESEVEVKRKDTEAKEIEVKTKRELERLRNHLMMLEENHTKDVLECQDREEKLRQELDAVKDILGKKSVILEDSSKQFQDHVGTLEEQLHVLAAQRDTATLDLEKCREKIESDAMAMFNLQNALEQLQKEKDEQCDYLMTVAKRKDDEYEERIQAFIGEQEKAQSAMSEASLAVQGITNLQLEMEQKDRELAVNKERLSELTSTLHQREMQCKEMLKASDSKMEKSLIKNLLMKYFLSPEENRADIVKVVGGLLGMSNEEIDQVGTGAAASKVGGWISNVWGYATPKKTAPPPSPGPAKIVDVNQSFSELFVKFLETESTDKKPVDSSASLTNTDVPLPSANIRMLSPTTPDILAFHNSKTEDLSSTATIPAPGQEIPRVHTHHAQSTLKNLLS